MSGTRAESPHVCAAGLMPAGTPSDSFHQGPAPGLDGRMRLLREHCDPPPFPFLGLAKDSSASLSVSAKNPALILVQCHQAMPISC